MKTKVVDITCMSVTHITISTNILLVCDVQSIHQTPQVFSYVSSKFLYALPTINLMTPPMQSRFTCQHSLKGLNWTLSYRVDVLEILLISRWCRNFSPIILSLIQFFLTLIQKRVQLSMESEVLAKTSHFLLYAHV